MAGSTGSLSSAAEELGRPASPPSGGQPDYTSALGRRIRNWFLEAHNHSLWSTYRREAKEDLGFYVGGEHQWSIEGTLEDLIAIKKAKRAHVSINHVQSIVDVLTGFERQNRYDIKAAPQGDEDVEQATLFTKLMKFEQERIDAPIQLSEMFEDGVITGAKALFVGVDWSVDPLYGEIILEQLSPGTEVIWDPMFKKTDMSDARFMLRYRHAVIDDIVAAYPEHEKELREAADNLAFTIRGQMPLEDPSPLSQFDSRDGYGSAMSHPMTEPGADIFWNEAEKKLMVLEAWYRDYEDVYVVADKKSGKVWDTGTLTAARDAVAVDPDNLTQITRKRRLIKMALVIPATMQILEEADTPYDNDTQDYPIIVFIAKKKGNEMYGVVRNLKDPQRVENKRESQALDIIGRFANIRRVAQENSLTNPNTIEDMWSDKPIWFKAGGQPPSWDAPPLSEVLRAITSLGDRGKMSMREVSGINTDLLGVKGDDSSGIAIARRQAQGQVISTVFFDNFRQAKRGFGRRLARRIQQVYSYEKTIRLTDPSGGDDMLLKINPAESKGKSRDERGRLQQPGTADQQATPNTPGNSEKILHDVTALDYDIVISETPATPSQRAMALLALLEIVGKLPGIAPALLDVIVSLSDIPDRQIVLERVKALMASQGIPGAGGGGAPGGGAPGGPGGPPMPAGGPPPGEMAGGPPQKGGGGATTAGGLPQ